MKYKVGDKVVLKISKYLVEEVINDINNLPNRIATIRKVVNYYGYDYYFEEIRWSLREENIKYLVKNKIYTKFTRFEIMDI